MSKTDEQLNREIEKNLTQLNRWYRHRDQLTAERLKGFLTGGMLGAVIGIFATLIVQALLTR